MKANHVKWALPQDTKRQKLHGLTRRLGSLSGKNDSRDWWRALKEGPELWLF